MAQISLIGVKYWAPGFAFLSAMDTSKGHMLADTVAIIGSLDTVFGRLTDER